MTGRYAYTIYDEGGLLDANSAGYPTGTAPEQTAYKTSLAFADLTQLKDASGNQLLTQAQIDSIINWRNAHPSSTREALIEFLTQNLAASASTRATLQNALQYFGTFTGKLLPRLARPNRQRLESQLPLSSVQPIHDIVKVLKKPFDNCHTFSQYACLLKKARMIESDWRAFCGGQAKRQRIE